MFQCANVALNWFHMLKQLHNFTSPAASCCFYCLFHVYLIRQEIYFWELMSGLILFKALM